MNSTDVVKIKVIYNTGSGSYEASFVASYSVYGRLVEDLKDVSLIWVIVKGKINDIDNNAVEFAIKRDDISSVDCIRVNGIE